MRACTNKQNKRCLTYAHRVLHLWFIESLLRVGSDGVWITSTVCYAAGRVDWICVRLLLARGRTKDAYTYTYIHIHVHIHIHIHMHIYIYTHVYNKRCSTPQARLDTILGIHTRYHDYYGVAHTRYPRHSY